MSPNQRFAGGREQAKETSGARPGELAKEKGRALRKPSLIC